MGEQKEWHTPSPLLAPDGTLQQVGWARRPVWDCNLENAHFYRLRPLQRFRIKRWDYYGLTTPTHYFSATLADLGYAGQAFVYLVDFTTGAYHEETVTVPLARGIHLPRSSESGESHYSQGDTHLCFTVEDRQRTVELHWPNFNGRPLTAAWTMEIPPEQESMTLVIPIGARRFYYNRKINCLPASGHVQLGEESWDIQPDTCLGNLDWGRGVWEYRSFWVWASASGRLPDGRLVGLNMGFGFGDTSAATENALILEGKIHKLDQVVFEYDDTDYRQPWRMRSPDGRLDLEFVPFLERLASTNLLVITSEVHQMFGRYSGTVVTDDGERLELDGLVGFAEEHHAHW